MSGYAGTPLIQKLGYQAGETVCTLHAPDWFVAELGKADIATANQLPAEWVHGFFSSKSEVAQFLAQTKLAEIGKGLWVSWPKKSAGVPTDLTEQTFRDLILPTGWVDIKVAAVDNTWRGLKFVRRKG